MKMIGLEVVDEYTYQPSEVYFEEFRYNENYYIKGNSIYFYFKIDNNKISDSELKGIIIYQNKDIDVTIVYKVLKDYSAIQLNRYKEKINLNCSYKNRYEYIYSSQDVIKFWLNDEHSIDILVRHPLPQCV